MKYFGKLFAAMVATIGLFALTACADATASPVYDVHRSNIAACGADAGVSATGFTAIAGSVHSFVTPDTAAKYDFSCKSNLHVLPAGVDPYNEGDVMAYLASIGFDARLSGQRFYHYCGLADADLDPDAAGVPDGRTGELHHGNATGCYADDGAAGTYGPDGTYQGNRSKW